MSASAKNKPAALARERWPAIQQAKVFNCAFLVVRSSQRPVLGVGIQHLDRRENSFNGEFWLN